MLADHLSMSRKKKKKSQKNDFTISLRRSTHCGSDFVFIRKLSVSFSVPSHEDPTMCHSGGDCHFPFHMCYNGDMLLILLTTQWLKQAYF